jgi:hypothetical protein
MPTDDTPPVENPSGPAEDARENRIVAWWKHRSGLEKILICAGIVVAVAAAWHFQSQHENSNREADIGSEVKTSMHLNS